MPPFYTWVGKNRDELLVREIRDDQRKTFEVNFQPTLYTYAPHGQETQLSTLDGRAVSPLQFDSIGAANKHVRQSKNLEGYTLFGNDMYQYVYIAENYPGQIHYDPKQIVIANVDIEVGAKTGFLAALDTVNTPEEVTAITMKLSTENRYQVFGTKPFMPSEDIDYIECDDEGDLLEQFLAAWTKNYPDGMTGWNITGYDIPYLVNRLAKRLDKKRSNKLSPFGHIRQITLRRFGKEYTSYSIAGVNNLDYRELYLKNVLDPLETYALDYVAEIELGERKLDYSEYRNLWELYQKNYQKFIEYNIHDVRLVDRLEAKKRIIDLQMLVAYRSKVNMEDVMSQVRTLDAVIYNNLRDRNIVVPFREMDDKDEQFKGAFVKEPKPGLYYWVVSFDVNSLYPSLIAALNIGVETKQPRDQWEPEQRAEINRMSAHLMLERPPNWELFEGLNISMGTNGATYDKSRNSIFTDIIVDLLNARKEFRKNAEDAEAELESIKQQMEKTPDDPALKDRANELDYIKSEFDLKQKMTKVLNNSLYGCVGNEFFRYYDTENAEAITVTGQFVIQYVEQSLNRFLNKSFKTDNYNYVIAADTDSNYINLEPMVKKYMPDETDPKKIVEYIDKVCKKIIEPEINRIFAEIRDIFIHGNGNFLAMKREVIADKGIWTKKKRYVLSIWDKEGIRYAKPKLKYTGLEMKRSTTPKSAREAMKKCCELILHGTQEELYQYVIEYREQFMATPIAEIAKPTGVKGLDKYSDAQSVTALGCPEHVRAALWHNHLIQEKGLQSVYPPILEGEKIKYVYLKMPNPTHQSVIGFQGSLPTEFGLDKYIDRKLLYTKCFFEPMQRIADAAGWKLEKSPNLASLFS